MSTKKKWGLLVAMALVFGVIAGFVMFGVNRLAERAFVEDNIPVTTTVPEATPAPGVSSDNTGASTAIESVRDVAAAAMPSVVTISTMSVEEMQSFFFAPPQQVQVEGAGTGVIVGENDTELLIATNNHVVEGATTLSVGFVDQSSVSAEIKGTDVDNDLAVVAVKLSDISDDTLTQIKIATIGDSDELELGDQVVAIGNALGYGESVTSGWVSALDRSITLQDESGNTIESTGLIQTDAAINPGNSGGALLNMRGELIGINEAKTGTTQNGVSVDNMGFAIPINKAMESLEALMSMPTREKVDASEASFLGIEGQTVSGEVAQIYGMPTGVVVESVTSGGPAEAAGVQKGDIITKLDTRSVSSMDQLQQALEYYAAGETVDLVVQRADNGEYKAVTLSVTLGHAQSTDN